MSLSLVQLQWSAARVLITNGVPPVPHAVATRAPKCRPLSPSLGFTSCLSSHTPRTGTPRFHLRDVQLALCPCCAQLHLQLLLLRHSSSGFPPLLFPNAMPLTSISEMYSWHSARAALSCTCSSSAMPCASIMGQTAAHSATVGHSRCGTRGSHRLQAHPQHPTSTSCSGWWKTERARVNAVGCKAKFARFVRVAAAAIPTCAPAAALARLLPWPF